MARLRNLLVVGIALAVGPWVVPSATAAVSGHLVLLGSRSASVEVRLPARTTLDVANMQIRGHGQFAGFYLEAIDKPPAAREDLASHIGALFIRSLHAPDGTGLTLGFDGQRKNEIAAGRYRIYLLTDASTRVTIPISGARTITLRPGRPAETSFVARRDILRSQVEAENLQPIHVAGTRSLSLSTLLVGRFRAYAGDIGACLQPAASSGCDATPRAQDGDYTSYTVSPLEDLDISFTVIYHPGVLLPGNYRAYQHAFNAATIQYAAAAAFSLSLQ